MWSLSPHHSVLSTHSSFTLRGDAPGEWDKPREGRQILGKVVGVQREGCCINPYGLKVKIQRLVYFCASSVKGRLKPYKMVTKLSVAAVNRVTRE